MRALIVMAMIVGALEAKTVIDRIAVVVGKQVIKASDIDLDLRVTAFLNREPLIEDAAAKKKSAERLIDQQIIRQEVASGGYSRASDADTNAMLAQIRQNNYGNSESRLKQALSQYGLTEEQLRAHLLWQLTVLRFIDQRFRAGVLVTDEDVRNYYEQHRAQFKGDPESSAASVRSILEGEQINRQFEQWLSDARKRTNIEYHEEAFR
jgi:peptidyl-prolyl cis-trans isomerase SurA